MAKRSYNNSAGRRPHGEKPYDPNNSFVKKMATKMTDLIPQRSWISKWFNSPNSNGDLANEDSDTGDEHDVDGVLFLQPPTKRPRIRMDVTHPPGTFAIQPRGRNDNCVRSSVCDEGFVFLENSEAGPSGLRTLVTSTPALRMEMRNSMETNFLKQNNCNANGDENSESGESTSGCSSLIPQASRQEGLSQFRKKMDDKNDYMSGQSPRSLFIDSITGTRESLSSKRPSFNASYVSNDVNPFDKCSVLSSPFYNGNITFGGSNAIGSSAMRRNRRNLAGNCDYQLRIPRRSSVQVKPSNAVNDSSGMSQTAKRILDALEHFSSPIADAKKIPIKTTLSTSFGKKRGRAEAFDGNPTSRVGLRHLTRELAVPTVPDMLKLKRRQRLQDTTLAARRIITAHSEPPPKPQSSVNSVNQEAEYHLRDENESQKYFGKLKAKSKRKPDVEQPVEAVNLPSIQLPITSLPSFDIPLPKQSNSTVTTTAGAEAKSKTFKFSSPIKLEKNSTSPVKSMNHFTFSKPLTPESSRKIDGNKGNSVDKFVSESNQTALTNNFVWTGSSTAPRPKEIKQDKIKEVELKTGSVMDVLGNNFNKSVTKIWECSECFIKNNQNEEHCVACKNARVKETTNKLSTNILPSSSDNQFGAKFKMSSEKWECKCCCVRNPVAEEKCLSCMTPRVEKKIEKIEATVSAPAKSDLDKFKPAKDSWECPGCMLRNPNTVISCPCCNASKPGLLKTPAPEKTEETKPSLLSTFNTNSTSKKWECPSCMVRNEESAATCVCCTTANPKAPAKSSPVKTTSGFGDKFKAPAGSWSCDSCMVQNKSEADECVACGGSKPGATKKLKAEDSAPKFSFGIPSTTTQKFTFGMPSTASTVSFSAPTTQTTAKFTFGVPTTVQEAAKPSGFTFAAPKSVEPFKSDEKKGDIQTLFNNVSDTKVGFSFSNPTESKPEAPKDPVKIPEKVEPLKISFGVPATVPEGTKTTTAAPLVFSFSEPKSSTSQSTPILTFGQSSVPTAPTEAPKPETTESQVKPLISFGKPAAAFSENTEVKPVLTFGAPVMNNTEKPVFSVENKLPVPAAIETKNVFGSANDKPLFNAPTPAPTFGVPTVPSTTAAPATPATPGLFSGSSASPSIFASKAPSFGAPTAPAAAPTIFSAVKSAEPPAPASSEIFTFGRGNTPAPPAAGTGFGSTNNAGTWNTGFFNNRPAPVVFGSYGEHKPPLGFDNNAAKSEPPAFGQAAAAPITNIFGNSQPSSASSFGTLNSASTTGGFSFGTPLSTPATATPSSASTSGGFSFGGGGGGAPPGTPASGFSFNAPAQPSFNFTGGNAPTAFSATPQAAGTQRKIKKAVRRMPPRT